MKDRIHYVAFFKSFILKLSWKAESTKWQQIEQMNQMHNYCSDDALLGPTEPQRAY